jgi:hypothetical protein
MSLIEVNTSPQAIAAQDRSAPGKVTGKLKRALDAMIWQGLNRAEAANQAGMAEHSLYVALTRPHVKAYYRQQLDVLRTSERARNIHTLAEVRDQKSNQMARVQAVKALEQLADDESTARTAAYRFAPGVVIVVAQPGAVMAHERGNTAKPLIEHDVGSDAMGNDMGNGE